VENISLLKSIVQELKIFQKDNQSLYDFLSNLEKLKIEINSN